MAYSINKATLLGNLGKDPELRYTQSGTAVCNFSVATSYGTKKADDTWENVTEWHRVVAWSNLAERCNNELRKGAKVYIEGRIQTRSWTSDQDNVTHYMTEIVATEMVPLDRRQSEASDDEQEAARPDRQKSSTRERAVAGPPKRKGTEDDFDSDFDPNDIPF